MDIIAYEGTGYRTVLRKAEAGELILVRWHCEDSAKGVFKVSKAAASGYVYYGAHGCLPRNYYVLEPITEQSPSVTDLLANLALRVSELERHNREQAYEINELYKEVSR